MPSPIPTESSCLPLHAHKFTLTVRVWAMCREQAKVEEGGRHAKFQEHPCVGFGGLQFRHPKPLVGLLMESMKLLVAYVSLCWISVSGSYEFLPLFSAHSLSVTQPRWFPQYSEWGEKEVGLLISVPYGWESQAFIYYTLPFTHRRNMGQRYISWHWVLLAWERDDISSETILWFFSMCLFS